MHLCSRSGPDWVDDCFQDCFQERGIAVLLIVLEAFPGSAGVTPAEANVQERHVWRTAQGSRSVG